MSCQAMHTGLAWHDQGPGLCCAMPRSRVPWPNMAYLLVRVGSDWSGQRVMPGPRLEFFRAAPTQFTPLATSGIGALT